MLGDNYKSTWQVGDEVGVYAVVTGGTLSATASENFLHNVKLTYNGTTWQPEEKLYWPNTGGTFDFYAYYPYSVSATDPANIAFSVETNQSTLTNSCQSDLLASEKVTKSAGEIVYLPFQHMLAMVELKVPYQIGAVINPSATTDASLRRVNAQCSLNLSTQVVTETPISNFDMKNMWQNIRMYRKEQPEDLDYNYSYTYRAYIPAQTLLTRDRLFLFADHEQQDTIILGHEVPEEITLVKGVATKFSCALCEDDGTIPVENMEDVAEEISVLQEPEAADAGAAEESMPAETAEIEVEKEEEVKEVESSTSVPVWKKIVKILIHSLIMKDYGLAFL